MATGLYVRPDGLIMVDYGPRRLPISRAHYKANGYKPVLEKLVVKTSAAKASDASRMILRINLTTRLQRDLPLA
jgi:hypothetical protein